MLAALAAIMTFDPVPGPAKLQLCEKIKGFPASEGGFGPMQNEEEMTFS